MNIEKTNYEAKEYDLNDGQLFNLQEVDHTEDFQTSEAYMSRVWEMIQEPRKDF